jgi:hypothetical protein
VHGAQGWRCVLEPVIDHCRRRRLALYFRGDAAFAKPELYELLLESERTGCAIRLPANSVLQERIAHLLTPPLGRPPKKPQIFHDVSGPRSCLPPRPGREARPSLASGLSRPNWTTDASLSCFAMRRTEH